jgi:excisionase family DNA binding protein
MQRRGQEERPRRITIKDAASILGVSQMTLRRWDKAGKFKAYRHPMNNYRFYQRDEVVKLRRSIDDET